MHTNWSYYRRMFLRYVNSPSRTLLKKCTSIYFCNYITVFLILGINLTAFGIFSGCGYVSSSSYLEHIETISIPPIDIQDPDFAYDNVSQRPFDEIIQEKMIQRFNRKWKDGNDAELTIKIQDYDIREHGFGPSGNVELLRMGLQVEYQFMDKVRDNVIAKADNYLQIHDFYIVENRGEPPETVDQAKNLIVEELIEDLYNQLAEQW